MGLAFALALARAPPLRAQQRAGTGNAQEPVPAGKNEGKGLGGLVPRFRKVPGENYKVLAWAHWT